MAPPVALLGNRAACERYRSGGMAAFCHRTHRLIRGEAVQIGGRAADSKSATRPRSHLARCRRRHAQLAHVVPGLAGGRNGLAVTPGRTRANRTWRRWLATGRYQVVGSGANRDRRWVDGNREPSESGRRDLTSRAAPDADEPTRSAGRDAEIPFGCGARGTGSPWYVHHGNTASH